MNARYRFLLIALFTLFSASAFAQFGPFFLFPRAICEDAINVSLPYNSCQANITPDMLDAGSYSFYSSGFLSRWTSAGTLGPGVHTVTLYVRDIVGTSSCNTTVTVEDKTAPTAICYSYLNVVMDNPSQPQNYVSSSTVDAGSFDNCSAGLIKILDLTPSNDWGPQTYTLTLVDAAGNSNSCWGTIDSRSPYAPNGYCTTSGNTGYEYIDHFGFGGPTMFWVNVSGDNGGSLLNTNYRALRAGDRMELDYNPGFVRGTYREYWQVFIDTNRDGDFNDPGELMHQWNGTTGNTTSVALPSSFPRYGFSRLRVVMSYGGYVDPCGPGFWGEYEDYTVELLRRGARLPGAAARATDTAVNPEAVASLREQAHTDPAENQPLTPPADPMLLPSRENVVYDLPQETKFSVYPNPATSGQEVNVQFSAGISSTKEQLELVNLVGRQLATYPLQPGIERQAIALPDNLPAGIYLLNRRSDNGQIMAAQRILIR